MSRATPQWRVRQIVKTLARIASELTVTDLDQIRALNSHAAGLALVAEALTPILRPHALTPQQTRVLAYVRDYIAQHDRAPTRKEIATAFSFASVNAAQEHLHVLERKGWLTFSGGGPRGIRINEGRPDSPTASKRAPQPSRSVLGITAGRQIHFIKGIAQ